MSHGLKIHKKSYKNPKDINDSVMDEKSIGNPRKILQTSMTKSWIKNP
jgi:hypothetical protein